MIYNLFPFAGGPGGGAPWSRKLGVMVDKPAGDTTPRAVQACHELLAWLIPLLETAWERRRPRRLRQDHSDGWVCLERTVVQSTSWPARTPALPGFSPDLATMPEAGFGLILAYDLPYKPVSALGGKVSQVREGIDLLGYHVFPHHRRLRNENGLRFRRRLRAFARGYAEGRLDWADFNPSVQAWIGHACHADTWGLRESLFAALYFQRERAEG